MSLWIDKRVNIILINTQLYCAIERNGIDTDIINKNVDNSDNVERQRRFSNQSTQTSKRKINGCI